MSNILDDVEKQKIWPKHYKWALMFNIVPILLAIAYILIITQFKLPQDLTIVIICGLSLIIGNIISIFLYCFGINASAQIDYVKATIVGIIGLLFSIGILLLIAMAVFGVSTNFGGGDPLG